VVALDCANATEDYLQNQALVVNGATIADDRFADAGVPLKAIIAA